MTNNNPSEYEGPEKCLLNDPDSQLCIYHLIAPKKVFKNIVDNLFQEFYPPFLKK